MDIQNVKLFSKVTLPSQVKQEFEIHAVTKNGGQCLNCVDFVVRSLFSMEMLNTQNKRFCHLSSSNHQKEYQATIGG